AGHRVPAGVVRSGIQALEATAAADVVAVPDHPVPRAGDGVAVGPPGGVKDRLLPGALLKQSAHLGTVSDRDGIIRPFFEVYLPKPTRVSLPLRELPSDLCDGKIHLSRDRTHAVVARGTGDDIRSEERNTRVLCGTQFFAATFVDNSSSFSDLVSEKYDAFLGGVGDMGGS